jgi:branched-chain amino acid transport system substrate-binding protein
VPQTISKFLILLLHCFGLIFLCFPENAPAEHTYKIGAIYSITGVASSLGVPERDATLMVQKQLQQGGGIKGSDDILHSIEIIVYDDRSEGNEAVKATKRLIEEDKVVALIGPSRTPASLAMVPIAEEAKIPMISVASSSEIVSPVEKQHWIYKTPHSNFHSVDVKVQYLKTKKYTKIASLYQNDSFGDDSREALASALKDTGMTIVREEKFEATDKDMTPQLVNIKGSEAQVLIVHATPPGASIVTRQFRDLGLQLPLIHNHGIGNKRFIELASEASEGVIFPIGKMLVAEQLPDTGPQKPALLNFIKDYEAFSKNSRNTFAGHAWDGLQLVLQALRKIEKGVSLEETRQRVRNSIEATQGFVGLDGTFNFSGQDHNGLSSQDLVMVRIEKEAWKYLPPDQW